MRIDYSVVPDGWVDCGRYYDTPQDWSGGNGVSFYLHSEAAGDWMTVMVITGLSTARGGGTRRRASFSTTTRCACSPTRCSRIREAVSRVRDCCCAGPMRASRDMDRVLRWGRRSTRPDQPFVFRDNHDLSGEALAGPVVRAGATIIPAKVEPVASLFSKFSQPKAILSPGQKDQATLAGLPRGA